MRQFKKNQGIFVWKIISVSPLLDHNSLHRKGSIQFIKKEDLSGNTFLNKILAIKDNRWKGRTIYDRVMRIRVKNMLMLIKAKKVFTRPVDWICCWWDRTCRVQQIKLQVIKSVRCYQAKKAFRKNIQIRNVRKNVSFR